MATVGRGSDSAAGHRVARGEGLGGRLPTVARAVRRPPYHAGVQSLLSLRTLVERATSWTAIIAFALGLLAGYLGAVNEAGRCLGAATPEDAAESCPGWLQRPD